MVIIEAAVVVIIEAAVVVIIEAVGVAAAAAYTLHPSCYDELKLQVLHIL